MQTTLHPSPTTAARPTAARRAALAVTGLLACALPTVFTINLTRMLLVGEMSGHRFHQLTGQGLVLCLLWLGSVVPLLRAGWRGRRPATATALMHLAFMGIGTAFAIAAPQGGAPFLMAVIDVTGLLVWWALPVRPRLSGELRIDPLLAPLGLLMAAVSTPYAVAQVRLQHEATGHHAQNPHFFDMAWFAVTLAVLVLLAALRPDLHRLALWGGGAAAFTGAVGVVLGTDLAWTAAALGLGVLVLAASRLSVRRSELPAEPEPVI
jgi:hypothetical protein